MKKRAADGSFAILTAVSNQHTERSEPGAALRVHSLRVSRAAETPKKIKKYFLRIRESNPALPRTEETAGRQ